jgi:N-acetyl sugar amidotransferase
MLTNINKKNVKEQYNLPEKIVFCNNCTMSNQRPRITFNSQGVCSACQYAVHKKAEVNWSTREKELEILCDKHRKTDGSFDVVVPCSGGKDGSFTAHLLKTKYGMNPLTVTWAPHLSSDIGRKNLEAFINSGFDNIYGTPNGEVHRLMTRLALIHLGDPFQPFIYGQSNFPLNIAVRYNIPLIMYGENGEVEYGGDMKNAFKPTREIADHDKHYFSGMPPEFWTSHGVSRANLHTYMPPAMEDIRKNKTEIHFMGYYHSWDPQENFYYCVENTGFTPNPSRSEGTYSKYASLDDRTDGFHYYLGFIKFGIGRATADSAHEIRDGKITREEGVALVKKFDGEFPEKYFKDFLEYCSLSEEEFHVIVDSWRADHIWKKQGQDWQLRSAVWQQDND